MLHNNVHYYFKENLANKIAVKKDKIKLKCSTFLTKKQSKS